MSKNLTTADLTRLTVELNRSITLANATASAPNEAARWRAFRVEAAEHVVEARIARGVYYTAADLAWFRSPVGV